MNKILSIILLLCFTLSTPYPLKALELELPEVGKIRTRERLGSGFWGSVYSYERLDSVSGKWVTEEGKVVKIMQEDQEGFSSGGDTANNPYAGSTYLREYETEIQSLKSIEGMGLGAAHIHHHGVNVESGKKYYWIVKDRVFGQTMESNLNSGAFLQDQEMQRKFLDFFAQVLQKRISIQDLHAKNIMYDEVRKTWLVVDAGQTEIQRDDPSMMLLNVISNLLRPEYLMHKNLLSCQDIRMEMMGQFMGLAHISSHIRKDTILNTLIECLDTKGKVTQYLQSSSITNWDMELFKKIIFSNAGTKLKKCILVHEMINGQIQQAFEYEFSERDREILEENQKKSW